MPRNDRSHQRTQQLHITHVEIAIGEFLDDQTGRQAAGPKAAISFRQINANQPQTAHLAQQTTIECDFMVAGLIPRQQFFAGKTPGKIAQCLLVFGKQHPEISPLNGNAQMACKPFAVLPPHPGYVVPGKCEAGLSAKTNLCYYTKQMLGNYKNSLCRQARHASHTKHHPPTAVLFS
jgi:hypothetical protein